MEGEGVNQPTGTSAILLAAGIQTLALIAGLSAANAAETWRCKLHCADDPSNKIAVNFDIRGAYVLRSPDDYSNFREPYKITTNTREIIVAANRKDKMGLKIDRRKSQAVMSGGPLKGGGWFDNWTGPCSKVR